MLKGNRLIKGFKKQDSTTIWNHLFGLGENYAVYSNHFTGLGQHLPNDHLYVYTCQTSLVVVCLDICGQKDELADEEEFNNEPPLYFTQTSYRLSPVWKLSETIKLIRMKMEAANNHWPMLGVLLTESNIVNYDDMQELWDSMDIKVFDKLEDLAYKEIKVNTDDDLVSGTIVEKVLSDLKKQVEPVPPLEADQFLKLLDDFVSREFNDNDDEKDEKDEEDDDDNGLDDDDETPEAENSHVDLPSGIIDQNATMSVR